MQTEVNSISVNGIEYVKASEVHQSKLADNYVIVRTYSAGVFAGELVKRDGKEVHLANARRLWMWVGAASLSQLAVDGVASPKECKFPCEVKSIILTEAIEIVPCTEKAQTSIKGVPVWKM